MKFPEHDHLQDLFINWETWKYEEGISIGAKETGRQLSLWDWGFSLGAIFDHFFDNRKAPKWSSKIISLNSQD